jgi:choice-of-anchor A domain-containing protein
MTKRILLFLLIALAFLQEASAQLTPFAAAKGFNVFTRKGFTFKDGHTDGPIAIGGDLTLQGFNIIAMSSTGTYPFGSGNANNYTVVINGRVYYTSGNQSTVSSGYLRLMDSTGTRTFVTDCNNAATNTRLAAYNSNCATAYSSNPNMIMSTQQTYASVYSGHGLNFDSLFNVLYMASIQMSNYTASNSCSGNFNIIAPPSNGANIALVSNKTNVINLTTAQLQALTSLNFSNGPTASNPLVINVNGTSSFTWSPINTGGLSSGNAPYITYNFYNNPGTITISGGNTIEGSIMAPLANVDKSTAQNIEGQIVCYSFVNNGGEVHHFPFNPNNSTMPKCPILTIGNIVWNDLDADGIKDSNEPGISGATAKLYLDANADNTPDGAALATTLTGSDGSYYFHTLTAGNYIVGITLPTGYTATTTTANSSNPNSNTDSDNNGVSTVLGEVRTNYITLSFGAEPTDLGDGLNVNYTLDIGLKGTSSIGDYVWNDLDKDGIQDASEPGLKNVTVTLTFPNGSTASTTTSSTGAYLFSNLGPGTYTVTFTTPTGKTITLQDQGGNDGTDSDISTSTGAVSVVLSAGENKTSIDAGYYKTSCVGSCGTGYTRKTKTNAITNGDFATAITSPASGNTYLGVAITYNYSGGSFISQSEYKGNGASVQPTSNRSFVIVNNSGTYNQGGTSQMAFPGDATYGVSSSNTYMYHNGNDLGGEYLVWQQTLTNLTVGVTYTFRFYVSNMLDDDNNNQVSEPIIRVRTGGVSGLPSGTDVTTNPTSPYTVLESSTSNAAALNGWKRMEYTFTAAATTLLVKIVDTQTNSNGSLGGSDDLGLTAIGVDECVRDRDGDCIPDTDDKDDDNDGILDLVESGGYDPTGDCDGDGILNYLDTNPGCSTPGGNDIYGNAYVALTWTDCNGDLINDFFDSDRDGIINAWDLDSDNDGIPDLYETRSASILDEDFDGMADGVDADGDGIMSSADSNDNSFGGTGLTPQDLDRDGKPNYLDLDSDADGITDLTEATGVYDSDGIASGTDTDADGLKGDYSNSSTVADNYNGFGGRGVTLLDSDADGKPNAYDIDSDNDGISDNIEAQATCSYKLPLNTDTDGDGVDGNYDLTNVSCNKTSAGLTPYDKDGDGIPDYLDSNSDGDVAPDINEASGFSGNFVSNYTDTDGDGMIDEFDSFNILTAISNYHYNVTNQYMGTNGSFTGNSPSGSNVTLQKTGTGDCVTDDRDWRNTAVLPLNIVQFTASFISPMVTVKWNVAAEVSVDYYDIELSYDGIHFTAADHVTALNNGTVSYTKTISIASSNKGFYIRLKQLNKDGKSFYSKVIFIKTNATETISITPNPFKSQLQVNLKSSKAGTTSITLYTMEGKKCLAQTFNVVKGDNQLMVTDVSQLLPGIYLINISSAEGSYNQKLVKVQ